MARIIVMRFLQASIVGVRTDVFPLRGFVSLGAGGPAEIVPFMTSLTTFSRKKRGPSFANSLP